MSKGAKLYYINGVSPATARKIACREFGRSYINLIVNEQDYAFDIFLKEGSDKEKIKSFRKYWGENFRVFIFKPEN